MKITVRVDDEWFEVEVGDLYARPVIASVDGEYFEVWPEIGPPVNPKPSARDIRAASATQTENSTPASKPASMPTKAGRSSNAVHAPIPGVIVTLNVEKGDQVATGQELCVLEAMKMKNAIRSPREGTIARVAVTVGEHVQHHDLLFEFSD